MGVDKDPLCVILQYLRSQTESYYVRAVQYSKHVLCYRGLLLGFNHVAFAVTSAKKLVYLNVRPFAPANCKILRSQINLYIAGGGQEPLRVAPLLTSLDCALRIVCMRSLLPLHFNGARRLPALHRGLPDTYMHACMVVRS